MRRAGHAGARAFRRCRRDHGTLAAHDRAGAADHGRGLPFDPRGHGRTRLGRAPRARAHLARPARVDPAALRIYLMPGTIHIIGAGLSGLAAAVELTAQGRNVVVHEATATAGGRCRSYHDHAVGMVIDNGNHLLLSGNHSALSYLHAIGADDRLIGPPHAEFSFIDLATRDEWTLRFNDGRLPWWMFDPAKRVPGTRAFDYLSVARLLWAPRHKTIGEVIGLSGTVYERLLRPVLLAALNIDPAEGSAALASAVLRETIAAGGQACRPLIAREGLSSTLVEPALALLAKRNAPVQFEHQLRAFLQSENRVTGLVFGEESVSLEPEDAVILAVPPYAAAALVPSLQAPNEFRAIVNAHF